MSDDTSQVKIVPDCIDKPVKSMLNPLAKEIGSTFLCTPLMSSCIFSQLLIFLRTGIPRCIHQTLFESS